MSKNVITIATHIGLQQQAIQIIMYHFYVDVPIKHYG